MAKETLALQVPDELLDWLEAEDKNYERRVHMDANGILTYACMVAEKVWPPQKRKDGKWHQGEQFSYLLCTHLTLHLFCIEPNYWDYKWSWSKADQYTLTDEQQKTHTGPWALFTKDWQRTLFDLLRPCFFAPR